MRRRSCAMVSGMRGVLPELCARRKIPTGRGVEVLRGRVAEVALGGVAEVAPGGVADVACVGAARRQLP